VSIECGQEEGFTGARQGNITEVVSTGVTVKRAGCVGSRLGFCKQSVRLVRNGHTERTRY